MRISRRTMASMEAIKHRFGDKLVADLIAAFAELAEGKNYSRKAIEASGVEEITKKLTNINIFLEINPADIINAYTFPPDLTTNHAMHNKLRRMVSGGEDAIKWLRANKGKQLLGSVDREKGKVGGMYAELPIKVVLYQGLFTGCGGAPFSAEELAAIFLHEVGHSFTYFENIDRMFTVNMALDTVVQQFIKTDSVELRTKLLEVGSDFVGGTGTNFEQVASKDQDDEVLTTVMIDGAFGNPKSLLYSYVYDMRNWEQVSDQFAVRLGLAGPLTSALNRIYAYDASKHSFPAWMFVNTLFSAIGLFYMPLIVLLLLMTGSSPDDDIYDKFPERIKRVKLDLTAALKDAALSKEDTAKVLSDLAEIDIVLAPLKDRELFITKALRFIWIPWRNQKKIMEKQQMLEELATSNLYVTSAKFRNISTT